MEGEDREKKRFLKKGEGFSGKYSGKIQYPQIPRKAGNPMTYPEVPPDSGRGTADDLDEHEVGRERSSSRSTVSNLNHRESNIYQMANRECDDEYGRLGTPSSGRSITLTSSVPSENASPATVSSPAGTDLETPSVTKKPDLSHIRQINRTAAQLRDMVANLDHADVMTARKREAYFAKLRDDLESDKARVEQEIRDEWNELERQKRLFEQRRKTASTENFGQSHFLRKENDELKLSNIEKVRRISELSVMSTKQREELVRLRDENERYKKRCSDLSKNNADLSSELAKMRTRLSAANKTIEDQAEILKQRVRKPPVDSIRNNRSCPTLSRPAPPRNVASERLSAVTPARKAEKPSTAKPEGPVAERPSSSDENESTRSLDQETPLSPSLNRERLACGCTKYSNGNGVFREWRHSDGTMVTMTQDPAIIELFAPNEIKLTFDAMGTVYVLLPDRTGFVLFSDGQCKIGRYLEDTVEGRGRFRVDDIKGIECYKYDEDGTIGWTGCGIALRCAPDWSKVVIGKVTQFNYVRGETVYVNHIDDSQTPRTKTLCFQHMFR
ncbi:hypothetical protein QR680_011308 [Steinernema hermaphroditum]|uniref:Uncharacterized protein n=1 Tax=Steinernema hermaphroditum TaxID=289476 RepID=A0AA39MD46_9BILA|nr:hypothetical protein QR680_011308 [Steinernema hermaphroditum]